MLLKQSVVDIQQTVLLITFIFVGFTFCLLAFINPSRRFTIVIPVFAFCCVLSAKVSVVFAQRFALFAFGLVVFQYYKGVKSNGQVLNVTQVSVCTFSFLGEHLVSSC